MGGEAPNVDPTSPFSPATTSGAVRDFVLESAGQFPYFGGDFASTSVFALPWGAVIVEEAPGD